MKETREGYTIVVGVPWGLFGLLHVPLLSLQRSRHERMVELILAVDATEAEVRARYGDGAISEVAGRYADLSPRMLFYTPWQRRLTRLINWNWVDCWLTWVVGLAAARTRYVLLHDFDAVVVDPDFLESQFDFTCQQQALYAGICRDEFLAEPLIREVLMTIELFVDAGHLRERYHPVQLFNRVRHYQGKRVECDILRDVQLRDTPGRSLYRPVRESRLVHPSQVVSQWHKLMNAGGVFRPPCGYTPLLVLPLFRYVAGDEGALAGITAQLAEGKRVVELEGKRLDVSGLDAQGVDWCAKQVERLAEFFRGGVQPEVERYCAAVRAIAPPAPAEVPAAAARVTLQTAS